MDNLQFVETPVCKGFLSPIMRYGIPVNVLWVIFAISVVCFTLTASGFLALLLYGFLHAFMFLLHQIDAHAATLLFAKIRLRRCKNKRFWGARYYAPF